MGLRDSGSWVIISFLNDRKTVGESRHCKSDGCPWLATPQEKMRER